MTPPTRWTAAQLSYVALGMNGLGLVVLFANLATGNTWWEVAIPVAIACLVVGGSAGVRARILRVRERRGG